MQVFLAPGSRIEWTGPALPGAGALPAADLVRLAWERWGERLVDHLVGDFAIVVWDSARRVTFLARDPLGVKPLYFRVDHGRLTHGFSVAEVRRRDAGPVTPDPEWIARYVVGLSMDVRRTAYQEIRKLPPGHCLLLDGTGAISERRFHEWRDDAPPARRRDERWVQAYRSVLEESIRCRMAPHGPLGTENSGGLDSATVTCFLARFLEDPTDRLHAFSMAFYEEEPALIRATNQASRVVHDHVLTFGLRRDPEADVLQALHALGQPEEHGNASFQIPFYEECRRRGIQTLFSGFGGDEVVTAPASQVRLELIDAGDLRNLWDLLPGRVPLRALRLLKTLAVGRRQPEYRPRLVAAWKARLPYWPLREEVATGLGLHHDHLETARYDAPFRRVNDFILEHHLRRMYLTTRLENCTVVAGAYGVDYRWPLWDARLVQQYLSTPSLEKLGPGSMGRFLHRRAVDGVVPAEIAWRRSKEMGPALPGAPALPEELRDLAAQARRHVAALHPMLEAIYDRERLRSQIAQAEAGTGDGTFLYCFRGNVRALRWLNLWLHGGPLPA